MNPSLSIMETNIRQIRHLLEQQHLENLRRQHKQTALLVDIVEALCDREIKVTRIRGLSRMLAKENHKLNQLISDEVAPMRTHLSRRRE